MGEIIGMLAAHKAKSVTTEFSEDGSASGLQFALTAPQGGEFWFALPARWEPVLKLLPRGYNTPDQAKRTAWRIVRDWLAAQMAIVDVGMADIKEVMLPYLADPDGTTFYQSFAQEHWPALPAPEAES